MTCEFHVISDIRYRAKGETDRSLKSQELEHCQIHGAGLYMPGKIVRQPYLFGLQKTVSTRNLKNVFVFSVTKSPASITESATGEQTMHSAFFLLSQGYQAVSLSFWTIMKQQPVPDFLSNL